MQSFSLASLVAKLWCQGRSLTQRENRCTRSGRVPKTQCKQHSQFIILCRRPCYCSEYTRSPREVLIKSFLHLYILSYHCPLTNWSSKFVHVKINHVCGSFIIEDVHANLTEITMNVYNKTICSVDRVKVLMITKEESGCQKN